MSRQYTRSAQDFAARIARRIVPRPGVRRTWLSRLFLRTSGAPRAQLPARLRAAVMQHLLLNWLEGTFGITVADNRIAGDLDWPDDPEVLGTTQIYHAPEQGVIYLCDIAARPIVGSLGRLRDALQSHPEAIAAYGDELHVNDEGRVDGHWLKPPRTDPLLVRRGLLLNGLVAVSGHAPGLGRVLEDLRDGTNLQTAMACFAGALPQAAFVGCGAPVVACPPPAPLDAVPPSLPDDLPATSVLIPTRNGWEVLSDCLQSLERTDWPQDRLKVIVIDNGSDEPETLRNLERLHSEGRIELLRDDGPFNFSRLNNLGVAAARGDLLVLLNNDTTMSDSGWLKKLAAYAMQTAVGAVGCKLLYPDTEVQHAGVVCGLRGGAQHVFTRLAANAPGYNHLAAVDRTVSAVTAACLAVRRDVFDQVGGLREDLAVSYNDVVFCADLQSVGYRNICVADPLFVHHESKSRGKDSADKAKRERHRAERTRAKRLHPELFAQDPYYSAQLSRKSEYRLLLE